MSAWLVKITDATLEFAPIINRTILMGLAEKIVARWLICICIVVFSMIVVGGVTRLTHSGLSMVDWKPILGVIPPITTADWQVAFEAYQQYPEYQKVNQAMALDEFKFIYYWEYGHRLLGRIIGLVFLVPFVVLLYLKMIPRAIVPRLLIAFVLGGLQGLLGWYMVKSGLIDIPRVSHYRLSAHLLLAMFLLAYLFWIILDLYQVKVVTVSSRSKRLLLILASFLGLQIAYGAFVAGLRAGLGFNTFPLMDGRLLAEAATMMNPFWVNLLENGVMVQFIHRWLAAFILVASVASTISALRTYGLGGLTIGWLVFTAVLVLQFVLGVATLLAYVPVGLASLHQAGAAVVMLAMVYLLYISRSSEPR